jgi:hypothetical protein
MRLTSIAALPLLAVPFALCACNDSEGTPSSTTTTTTAAGGSGGTPAGGSGGTPAGGSGGTPTGGSGGIGGSGGTGGTGGTGGMVSPLSVGVGKQLINPTLVETEWQDLNGDGLWDQQNESFTDTNGNGMFDAIWIAGFDNGRVAKGINDALEVRAIAFRSGDTTVAICILDTVGYFIDDMDLIRADPKVQALGLDHVLIGSTHVHEGVDTVGLWGPNQLESGVNAEYQALTRDRAALAIEEAVTSLKPARMRAAQRLTQDPVTKSTLEYVNDTRDPIIYDPTLTIAQFVDDADPTKTIASLVHWAAHPEYTGSDNNMLSADYVHWLRDVVDNGVPSEGIAGLGGTSVFVQGALGGQVGPGGGVAPIGADGTPVPQPGLAKAEAAGTRVAKLALAALTEDGKDAAASDIVVRTQEIFGRVENQGYLYLAGAGVIVRPFYMYDPAMPIGPDNLPWVRSQVSYLQVGPLAIITAPGELHPELWVGGYDGSWSFGQMVLNEVVNAPDLNQAPEAPYLRDLMLQNPGVEYPIVAGLTQDFLGYIVPSFNFVVDPDNPYLVDAEGDHYEETNAIGALCEEHLQHPMMTLATAP